MRSVAIGLTVVTALLLRGADTILVTDGSPCDVQCGNTLSSTTDEDVVCEDNEFDGSSAGGVFERCTQCELKSNYTANGQTDLQWMLYNVRYALSYCFSSRLRNEDVTWGPCITSTACGPLKDAIDYGNLTTKVGAYDFCHDWSATQANKCSACLGAGEDTHYLNNFLVMLNASCAQLPEAGQLLSVDGNPFSTTLMNLTTPTPEDWYTYHPDTSFPLGARVGIAAGGIAFILGVAGCCIIWNGKRRRRRFLRELEKKHFDQSWPHPKSRHGGSDMLETPASQKPLRGWDDTPISAVTEASTDRGFGRYFSPYSSQYTSPVSAVEGPAMRNWPALSPQKLSQIQEQELEFMRAQDELIRLQQQQQQQQYPQDYSQPPAFTQWPSSTQEKLMQLQHEREQQTLTEGCIGVAFGGDEASLRSKPSDHQLDTGISRSKASTPAHLASNNPYGVLRETFEPSSSSPAKGKNRDEVEAYEMYEVPISGGGTELRHYEPHKMPAEPQAPVLHHPGYGRHPSLRRTGTGSSSRTGTWGLTEEDARRGHAV